MILGWEAGEEPQSIRPTFPPMVPFAVALWVATGLSYTLAASMESSWCIAGGIAAGCSALVVVGVLMWLARKPMVRVLFLVILGCCVGCACGLVRAAVVLHDAEAVLEQAGGVFRFEVIEDGRLGNFGASCVARIASENSVSAEVSVRYPAEEGILRFGDIFEARARFSEPSDASRATYRQKGIAAIATVDRIGEVREEGVVGALAGFRKAGIALYDAYDGSGAAFLRAIVFGDRSVLDQDEFYQQVKTVGLAHVVAVSGAHTSIVCALIGALLGFLRVPRKIVVVLQAGFIVAYLVCAGMPISGIRAAIMTAVALGALFARRRSSALAALSVCVCGILIASPEAAVSVSFALSALATFGIVAFGGLFRGWCERLLAGRFSFVSEPVALTASSGIVTMPLSASIFSQLPLISPLSNIVATPFFALFCGGGLAVSILCIAARDLFGWMLDLLVVGAQGFCEGIGLIAAIPCAAIPCALDLGAALALSAVLSAILWVSWPNPSRKILWIIVASASTLLLAFCVVLPRPMGDEVIMLDVGQGDAIIVRSRGATILIDTGNQDSKLLEALARNGVFALDAIVITHPDDDHCGSLPALKGLVRVGKVCVAENLLTCSCAACVDLKASVLLTVGEGALEGLALGDKLAVGALDLQVIWPKDFQDDGGNGDSLTFLMNSDLDGNGLPEWTGLFCGDAENDQLKAMIEAGRVGKVDLYKVGHHGSKAALDEGTAHVLTPSISLVSSGENNRYGHPAPQTLEVLESAGSMIERTDQKGDVVCKMTMQSITVDTLR